MAKFVYDRKTGKTELGPGDWSGLVGFISWRRVIEQLARADEFRENEKCAKLEISEEGIRYKLEQ